MRFLTRNGPEWSPETIDASHAEIRSFLGSHNRKTQETWDGQAEEFLFLMLSIHNPKPAGSVLIYEIPSQDSCTGKPYRFTFTVEYAT